MDVSQSSPAELDLLLRIYLETLSDGICILDCNGKIIYINQKAADIINKKKEKVIGIYINKIIPSTIFIFFSAIRNLFSLRKGITWMTNIPNIKGQKKTIYLSIKAIRVNRKCYYVIIIHKNRLLFSGSYDGISSMPIRHELYFNILNIIPEIIVLKDREGRWLLANQATIDTFNITGDYSGKTTRELAYIYPELSCLIDIDLCEKLEKEALRKKEIVTAHWHKYCEGIGERYFSIIKKPVIDEERGEIDFIATVLNDITNFKQLEKKLTETKQFNETIIDYANILIIVLDSIGKIIRFNKTAEKITGYKEAEVRGQYVWDVFLSESERKPFIESFLLNPKAAPRHGELKITTKAGDKKIILWSGKFIRDKTNHIKFAIVTAIDITRQREIENQLRQAEKMQALGTMAGGIAHDFNNIIGGIKGHLELLKLELKDKISDPNIDKIINKIEQAANKASEFTNQILSFAKNDIPLTKEEFDINTLIPQVLTLSTMQDIKFIKVRTELFPSPLIIDGNPAQIQRVIYNICINAIQAMNGKGELIVKTDTCNEKGRDWCRITIKDTGCGIRPELINRIFDPFVTTKEREKSGGLGLTICYNIVKKHQGFITVDSKEGVGTTFTIYLPLKYKIKMPDTLSKRYKEIQELSKQKTNQKDKILVAEDDTLIANLFEQTLNLLGYESIIAYDGQEAIELFKKYKDQLTLVFLDLNMPKVNGEEVAKTIQRINSEVKVIIMGGLIEEEKLKHLPGVVDILKKPFTLNELSTILSQWT